MIIGQQSCLLRRTNRHSWIESNAWEPTLNSDIHALYSQKLFYLQHKVDVFDNNHNTEKNLRNQWQGSEKLIMCSWTRWTTLNRSVPHQTDSSMNINEGTLGFRTPSQLAIIMNCDLGLLLSTCADELMAPVIQPGHLKWQWNNPNETFDVRSRQKNAWSRRCRRVVKVVLSSHYSLDFKIVRLKIQDYVIVMFECTTKCSNQTIIQYFWLFVKCISNCFLIYDNCYHVIN